MLKSGRTSILGLAAGLAAVLLLLFLLMARSVAARTQNAGWELLSLAKRIDFAAVEANRIVEDAAGTIFQSDEILGGERETLPLEAGFRWVWDGDDADPTRLDPTGLGGVDLTAGGLRDHFALRLGPNSRPVRLVWHIHQDAGRVASHEEWIAVSDQARDHRIFFHEFAAGRAGTPIVSGAGALVLDVMDAPGTDWVRSLVVDSSLRLYRRTDLVEDRSGDGRPGDGDLVAVALRIENPGPEVFPGFEAAFALSGRFSRVLPESIHGDHAQIKSPQLSGILAVGVNDLEPGGHARLAYRVRIQQVTVPAQAVVRVGDVPTGSGGNPVTLLNVPFVNGVGEVGFTGRLEDGGAGEGFVWIDDEVVWRNGLSVNPVLSGAEFFMGLGDQGEFIYSPSADGDDAVWRHTGLLVAANDPAPGFTAGTTLTFNSRPTMLPDGTSHWVAGFNDSGVPNSTQGRVLYGLGSEITATFGVVLRSDDVVDGYTVTRPSGVGFDYWFSQDGAHHIHELVLETGSTNDDGAIYLDGTLIAREGSPAGGGDNWDNFGFPVVNEAGHYLFSGETDGDTASNAILAYDGAIRLREGGELGGVSLSSPASVSGLGLNDQNQAAFIWDTMGGSTKVLFVACDAGNLAGARPLLATGDLVDLDADQVGDAALEDLHTFGHGLALSEDGFVYVEAVLDQGLGNREAILKLSLDCGETPEISLEKTVGLDPLACAAEDQLTVTQGTSVIFCYRATNTGSITLTHHALTDTHVGGVLIDYPLALPPGHSTYVTATAIMTHSRVNTATWSASMGYLNATASATATVTVNPGQFLPVILKDASP